MGGAHAASGTELRLAEPARVESRSGGEGAGVETGFSAADSRDDFARARRNAVLARLGARLRMREGDVDVLLPFDEVVGALGARRPPPG